MTQAKQTWDIFCRVIDNYGDIGVCWRFARQLANEYPVQVRLWVDELGALQQLWPTATSNSEQMLDNIEVRLWREPFPTDAAPADVVVEAFACHLPGGYCIAMKQKNPQPVWFNLEYLSAEDWVDGCHGLTSMHPQLGIKKQFFFPGFTAKTGGLLREKNLLIERDAFLQNPTNTTHFLQQLGIQRAPTGILISLFGYENESIGSLLDAWIDSPIPIVCAVPAGKILPNINAHLHTQLCSDDTLKKGALELIVIPFLTQTDYDRLLWCCDVNFVRGEDSFVRAQWAAKPFIWHIYPQDDDAHLIKLSAFLDRYCASANTPLQHAIPALWHAWNRNGDMKKAWSDCLNLQQEWRQQGHSWCQSLTELGDLTANMVLFCQKTL